jgi:hypothetical protein
MRCAFSQSLVSEGRYFEELKRKFRCALVIRTFRLSDCLRLSKRRLYFEFISEWKHGRKPNTTTEIKTETSKPGFEMLLMLPDDNLICSCPQ